MNHPRNLLLALAALLSGCGKFIYGAGMVNYGHEGIIILEITGMRPYVREPNVYVLRPDGTKVLTEGVPEGLEGLPFVVAAGPRFPSKFNSHFIGLGRFANSTGGRLPETPVEIVWQQAKLEDCKVVRRGDGPPPPFILTGLKPTPEEEQKRLQYDSYKRFNDDVRALGYDPTQHMMKDQCTWVPLPDRIHRTTLDIEAIKASPEYQRTGKSNPDVAGGHYTLEITLVFRDDYFDIKLSNGTTNPWR